MQEHRRRETDEELARRTEALERRIAREDPERLLELTELHMSDDGGWDEDEEDYWRNDLRSDTEEELIDAWDERHARCISKLAREIVKRQTEQETGVSGYWEE